MAIFKGDLSSGWWVAFAVECRQNGVVRGLKRVRSLPLLGVADVKPAFTSSPRKHGRPRPTSIIDP
jgi:hypothetical protein